MKTIQIPTSSNPCIVVINNTAYSYRAGDTVEVPDEVAEAIEDALKLEPKPMRYLSRIAQRAEGSLTELGESDLEGVEDIATYAFAYCSNIKSATIPDSVTSIRACAFYSNGKLVSVRFGNKLATIEKNAFDWCTKLEKVYLPETPSTLQDITAFQNINAACVFYCKTQESLDAYKVAEGWSTLASTYTFVVEE